MRLSSDITETIPPGKSLLLFDGVCNLCHGAVQFFLKRDTNNQIVYASLQSDLGREILVAAGMDDQNLKSLVLVEEGEVYLRSEAALRAARHLRGGWKLVDHLRIVPRFIRDTVYDLIAANRYRWFGQKESCPLPSPQTRNKFLG